MAAFPDANRRNSPGSRMRGRHGGAGSSRGLDAVPGRRREVRPARMQLALVCSVLALLCLVAVGISQLGCGRPTPAACSAQPLRTALQAAGLLSRQHAPIALRRSAQPAPTTAQALCASAMGGIPKVAMLFLARTELWHEGMWREWFRSAAGLVPREVVRAGNCSADTYSNMAAWCTAPLGGGSNVIGSQHLYTVYVHTQPDGPGFPKASPFHGRELPLHINTTWGTFDLVDATKALLRAALLEPANAKMVLLSESCVPLYPPTVVYQQLISEPRSRVNACPSKGSMPERWHPRMARSDPRMRITPRMWRKSSQWVVLGRALARVVADDVAMADVFRATCWERDDDEVVEHYTCYPDEHYIPTLLAYHGLANQTDCLGYTMHVSWSWEGPHPVSYSPENVTADLFRDMRLPAHCDSAAVFKLARFMYVEAGAAPADDICREDSPWSHRILGRNCPLFARKFPKNTTETVEDTLLDCRSRLGIIPCRDTAQKLLRPAS